MKPHIPFSLFDFKFIKFWGTKRFPKSAVAGAEIDETIIKCKHGEIIWIQSAGLFVQKTTGTNTKLQILRKHQVANVRDFLIHETTANNTYYSYPSSKPATNLDTLAEHLCFMQEGDVLNLKHTLTGGETINDDLHITYIVYNDPRVVEVK